MDQAGRNVGVAQAVLDQHSFGSRRRSRRMGRNPNTGAAVEIPAKTIPFFKPSKKLLELINSSGPDGGLGG